MAVKIVFPKRPRITKTVRFGDFLAGHLQIMQAMAFFRILQVNTINCEIGTALFGVGGR